VRWDGFDAQETSCELNTIKRQGTAWLASFGCSGPGLSWLEDDEIRVSKDGWSLEAKIKHVRRVGDPISLLLDQQMLGVAAEVAQESAQLAVALTAPLLQALRCRCRRVNSLFEDPGSALKGGVKVCK